MKQTTLAIIIGVFLLAMGGAIALISLHWARGIFKPIERMHGTMSAAEGGDDQRARGRSAPGR